VSKAIRLEDEASAELDDAARWYEERQAGLGQRYLEAIDSTFDNSFATHMLAFARRSSRQSSTFAACQSSAFPIPLSISR
jgi:hypothetical protein